MFTCHVSCWFEQDNEPLAFEDEEYSTVELRHAAKKVSSYRSVVGTQRMSDLQKMYPMGWSVRETLLICGFVLRGVHVTVRGQNSFIITWTDVTT